MLEEFAEKEEVFEEEMIHFVPLTAIVDYGLWFIRKRITMGNI